MNLPLQATITPDQRKLNLKLHNEHDVWGGSPYYLIEVSKDNNLDLVGFIKSTKPKSILDFGCGKGYAADNLKKLFPNIPIVKYDPCFPEFEQYPTGVFDLVICYNVLQMTDAVTLPLVAAELAAFTDKYLFINVNKPLSEVEKTINLYTSLFNNFKFLFKKAWKLAPDRLNHTRKILPHWINNYHITLIMGK